MGTRNLTAVIKDTEYKIAQYGQWDGYPEGQGEVVYDFLKGEGNLTKLTGNLDKVRWATQADFDKLNEAIEADGSGWVTFEQSKKASEMFPELSRDTGAEILELVANAEREIALTDEHEFIKDELFCEWAYVIDLDVNQLRVYAGGENLKAVFMLDELPDEKTDYFHLCHGRKR